MDKKLRYKRMYFTIIFLFLALSFSFAENSNIGNPAPEFSVRSGDDRELNLNILKGKVIVMFYETKDVIEKNRKLKNELNKFYNEQSDSAKEFIVRLPVINCSRVFPLFAGAWKGNLVDNSKKEGIVIYGDWDGKMFKAFGMKDKDSNVIIIDKNGIIKYFSSGEINNEETGEIEKLLNPNLQ